MKPRHRVFFGALGCAAMIFIDYEIEPHVVFTSSAANVTAIQVALLLPIVMLIAGPPIQRTGARRAVVIANLLTALVGAALAAVVAFGRVVWGVPDSPELWSTGSYTLAVYEHLGEDFDGTVDQVCRITPTLMITRHLREFRGLPSEAIGVVDPFRVRIYDDTLTLTPIMWPGC